MADQARKQPARPGRPEPSRTADEITDSVRYRDAMIELEAILAELERDDVDIDTLGPQVQRAAALIRVCRDRIAAARLDVEQIVLDLDGPGDA